MAGVIGHEGAMELAASALDFDLSAEDDERLQEHVHACADCRTLVEALAADHRALAALPATDAPDELRARVLSADARAGTSTPADSAAVATGMPRRRSVSVPRRYRWPLVLATAAAVIVAVIGGGLSWRPGPIPPPSSGSNAAVGGPTGTPAPATGLGPANTPVPTAEPTVGPDSKLAASPWQPVAELVPDEYRNGVVGVGTGFTLTTLDATPANVAAGRLTVEPALAFSAEPDPDGKSVHIVPQTPLTPGAAYHFTLHAGDGTPVGSWAFQAHQPLRIVATLPEDTQTDVPLTTGIEVTFDQDGVVDPASHFSIKPAVAGRSETHGRVLSFVPDAPLTPSTIYTVTVSGGVEVGGTGERLEQDVIFRFETGTAGTEPAPKVTFQFPVDLFESATADSPIVSFWAFQNESDDGPPPPPPTRATLEVYRIDGLDAATDVYRHIRSFPRWSRYSSADLVPTTGLTRLFAYDAHLSDSDGVLWTTLPETLAAGWYLVQVPSEDRTIQAMLQVTDIASYLAVSDTKTLIWTNDLVTGGPLANATVAAEGTDLGRTGPDGVLTVATPTVVVPAPTGSCPLPCVALMTVRSGDRAAFVPASGADDPEGKGAGWGPPDDGVRYWHTFDTDRTLYRASDVVHAWGVIRDRDTGLVPKTVTVDLTTGTDGYSGTESAPITTIDVHPDAIGAFTVSVALDGLPFGSYQLDLGTAGHTVASAGFEVGPILKPAYRLDIETGRRVYVVGEQVRLTAHAHFFEGSPVPGVRLRADGLTTATFVTDATGTATRRIVARLDDEDQGDGGPRIQAISVTPARAEEGEIAAASRDIMIFPSMWTVTSTATLTGGRVRVTGSLREVDRVRLEREIAASGDAWGLDPAGRAVGGRTVTATFTEVIPRKVQRGTRYDFVEKKVVPIYDYDTTERPAGTRRLTSGSDGGFSVSIPATSGHGYIVRLAATDPDRHVARWSGSADLPAEDSGEIPGPTLHLTSDATVSQDEFGVGQAIDLTMSDPQRGSTGATDRYLFYTAQRGLRDHAVQAGPRYRTTFGAAAAPDIEITGVRFTGSRYSADSSFYANLRTSDRALTVTIATDAPRYAPGGLVTLRVTTRDRTGRPIPATVVLRAVDEKLFAISGAEASDTLGELYAGVEAGIRVVYRSHKEPQGQPGDGGGDTTGGGEDFRDTLLFTSVKTGSDGRATVTMRLSDDLTSWHVSASAIGAGLSAGEGSIQVPVGLPFFADATVAPEYLVSDRPAIGLRAFGTALKTDARVTFAVDSDSLGLHVSGIPGRAFRTVPLPLPKLTIGRHSVTITVRTGTGASARVDRLVRTFTVIASRLERTQTSYADVTASSHVKGGAGLTDITVADAGAGRYIPLLLGLAGVQSGRLEQALGAAVASSIAKERFRVVEGVGDAAFDGRTYTTENGGLSLLPYSSADLEATVLAALVAPERFDASEMTSYLSGVARDPTATRERRLIATAGLAGLGAGVLPEIRSDAGNADLTIRERLFLGLGAAALGDSATAHAISSSLVEGYGEALGDQARLRVGSTAQDAAAATALMALLAAANGDPLAPRFWSYVEANPDVNATFALQAVGYVQRVLDHTPATSASFAYVIGGSRKIIDLAPGQAFHLTVTAPQLASLAVEPVTGRIAVTSSWREPVKPSSFTKDPDLTVVRTVSPAGTIGTAEIVTVDLALDLGLRAPSGCVEVTDFVPSGLVPVGVLQGWVDPDAEDAPARAVVYPYRQVGQRVSFCAAAPAGGHTAKLRYFARVVTPGSYTWEPAIAQSPVNQDQAAVSGSVVIRIH